MTADALPVDPPQTRRTRRMDTPHETPADDTRWYTSRDVCALAGITYRQLDYWLRAGHVGVADPRGTTGSGYPRRFDQAQADQICVLAWFVQAGFDLGVVRALADQLLESGVVRLSPQLVLVLDEGATGVSMDEYDAWRRAQWEALPDFCFVPWCESSEIDTRGLVSLRDGSVQKACVDHWERTMLARGQEATWERGAMRYIPGGAE